MPPPFCGLPDSRPLRVGALLGRVPPRARRHQPSFSEFCQERGAPALPRDDFIGESPLAQPLHLPRGDRLRRARGLSATTGTTSKPASATSDPAWDVPDAAPRRRRPARLPLHRFAGSADVELMRKLIGELAGRPTGDRLERPAAEELELAPNMAGAEFLPQTSILPKVDLVITHGGNNTVDRVTPLRQADGGAADLLGPARQRAADRRDRLRGATRHLRARRREMSAAIERLLGDGSSGREARRALARGCRRRAGRKLPRAGWKTWLPKSGTPGARREAAEPHSPSRRPARRGSPYSSICEPTLTVRSRGSLK